MSNTPEITNYFSYMESQETLFRLSLMNTAEGFISKIRYANEFSTAKDKILNDPESYSMEIIERARILLDRGTDSSYRHVYDSTLGGYLLLLYMCSIRHALLLIHEISVKQLPNLYWAKVIANNIIHSSTFMSESSKNAQVSSQRIEERVSFKESQNVISNSSVNYQLGI